MVPFVYFFGNLGKGLTQYPGDDSAEIFKDVINQDENVEQVVVRRKGNLLYYCYLRRVTDDDHRTFGICIAYNMVCCNIQYFFEMCSNMFEDIVEKGVVLKINNKGETCVDTANLLSEKNELDERCRVLESQFQKAQFVNLPPVNLGVSNRLVSRQSLEGNNDDIKKALSQYSQVYIVRKNRELLRVSAASLLIERQSNEIKNLLSQLTQLKAKQKNLTWVIILSVLLLVIVTIAYFIGNSLHNDLDDTLEQLADTTRQLNYTRHQLEDTCMCLSTTRLQLYESNALAEKRYWEIDALSYEKQQLTDSINNLKSFHYKRELDILREDKPFHVLESSFYWSSGELKIYYYSTSDKGKYISTEVRLSRNDSIVYTDYTYRYIYSGVNQFTLYLSKYLDSGKYYKFLFFVDDKFIGGVRH